MEDKANLVKPLFITNPKEDLAVADPYTLKGLGGRVFTSTRSFLEKAGIDVDAIIRGGQAASKLMPQVMSATRALTSGDIMSRISAAGDLSKMALSGISPSLLESFEDLYKDYGETVVQVGDVAQRVYSTDFSNLSEVGGLINKMAGKGTFLFNDPDGYAALSLGVIQEATRYGIPNSFEALTRTLDSDTLLRVANGALPIAIESGDIRLLGQISNSLGNGNLAATMPNILNDFSKQYGLSDHLLSKDKIALYTEIGNTFAGINPTWKEFYRLGDDSNVLNSTSIVAASKDFQSVFHDGTLDGKDEVDRHLLASLAHGYIDPQQKLHSEFGFRFPTF